MLLFLPPCFCVQFDCCGVSGPEDFEESLFRLLSPSKMVPEACCQRNSYLGAGSVEQCVSGSVAFRHNKVVTGNTILSLTHRLEFKKRRHSFYWKSWTYFIIITDVFVSEQHFNLTSSSKALTQTDLQTNSVSTMFFSFHVSETVCILTVYHLNI